MTQETLGDLLLRTILFGLVFMSAFYSGIQFQTGQDISEEGLVKSIVVALNQARASPFFSSLIGMLDTIAFFGIIIPIIIAVMYWPMGAIVWVLANVAGFSLIFSVKAPWLVWVAIPSLIIGIMLDLAMQRGG